MIPRIAIKKCNCACSISLRRTNLIHKPLPALIIRSISSSNKLFSDDSSSKKNGSSDEWLGGLNRHMVNQEFEYSLPPRIERSNETPEQTRARLLYQSRKRGTLENGLLLSTFAEKYLESMSTKEMKEYDDVSLWV